MFIKWKKREAYNITAEVTIYLKEGCSGRGMGSRALAFVEERAKVKGIRNLIAIITEGNESSVRLFEKNNYFNCANYKNVGEKFGKILGVVCYQKELK